MPANYEIVPKRIHVSPWARQAMSTPNMPPKAVPGMVASFEADYNQPNRYHHNIRHINFMMKTIEQWRKHFDDPGVALWATVGHDSFMDFTSQTPGQNEQISGEDTKDRLDGILEVPRLSAIVTFIGATATHRLPESNDNNVNLNDLAMFLDADNGCVGADPKIYNLYKTGVRQEYLNAGVTADQYNHGRLHFLRDYNNKQPLFISAPGHKRFETQAHINMVSEIAELEDLIAT